VCLQLLFLTDLEIKEMREIKFRAWVTDGKSYSEMYPNVQNHIGSDFGFGHMLQNTVDGLDCKVMQYTGLKDKNGVDIYEGDIVQMYHQQIHGFKHEKSTVTKFVLSGSSSCTAIGEMPDIRVVTWVKGGLELYCYDGGFNHSKPFSHLSNPGQSFEVIGNIHENPELTKPL